jgi:hypothetical protein
MDEFDWRAIRREANVRIGLGVLFGCSIGLIAGAVLMFIVMRCF